MEGSLIVVLLVLVFLIDFFFGFFSSSFGGRGREGESTARRSGIIYLPYHVDVGSS